MEAKDVHYQEEAKSVQNGHFMVQFTVFSSKQKFIE
jgi:hypothetical protein